MKLGDNLPPTQIVRDIQGLIDHYKTTLTTVDGRALRLADVYADAEMLVALITDETLGTTYEARIRTAIETEPI